ncbi:UBA domain-containing protein [Thermospira aquatica]|uniref:Uncharacterized protein n=1 Tax=Thermospira aquatica TaxID=2828656 RepID=A0AAX3BBW7_9SPIR|nr:hypothetical protein [Thermospira aquatica]URA09556.1 hypothetical protein KDW03_08670 [Thermospira aquatica]
MFERRPFTGNGERVSKSQQKKGEKEILDYFCEITGLKPKLCRQALEAARKTIYVGKKLP